EAVLGGLGACSHGTPSRIQGTNRRSEIRKISGVKPISCPCISGAGPRRWKGDQRLKRELATLLLAESSYQEIGTQIERRIRGALIDVGAEGCKQSYVSTLNESFGRTARRDTG